MGKVFIIEDDDSLRRELASVLELDGHTPQLCTNFDRAPQDVLAARPDVVILDLRLPGTDGLSICRGIRASSDVPVLVLTSSDAEFDEVMSMRLGADDYLTKPYRPAVLLAHVARLLQRASSASASLIEYEGISLDVARATASYGGHEVGLTRNEVCILAALIRARSAVVSRQELMCELWQTDEFVDDNTLTVNVNRLRRTLEQAGVPSGAVKTRRGLGYSL